MTEGRLIRKLLRFERNFTQIPNDWMRGGQLCDDGKRELSLQARGLLGMLLTHDHNFAVSIKGLARDGHGGVALIRSAVEELEKHGYLIRRPGKPGHGDDWELADPSGMSDPALFGYSGLRQGGRKFVPPQGGVRKSDPYGSENSTPNKNTKEHLSRVNPGDPSTRAGDEEEPPAAAVPTPDEWADLIDRAHGGNGRTLPPAASPCPKRRSLPCSIASDGRCLDCGMTPIELVAYLAAQQLAEAPSDEQPAEVVVS